MYRLPVAVLRLAHARALESQVTLTRRSVAAVVSLTAAVALALVAVSHAGTSLVVEDPLQHAPAAVVFGGRTPSRAIEAASLYKAGWAREVWLTEGALTADEVALGELGIERTPEYVYNRQVLERLGVPGAALRVIEGRNNNTADEVRTIARAVKQSGGERVILITSNYHTRRVRTLWHNIVGNRPEAIVRYARDEQFDAAHWWRDTADAWSVSREWFGLLNAWTGFPVKSEHW
jgi:uncharacterized SAM-binding protein YcdF (DUF218 family)